MPFYSKFMAIIIITESKPIVANYAIQRKSGSFPIFYATATDYYFRNCSRTIKYFDLIC